MSSGFDLLTGAPKKLWVSICITLCLFLTFCSQSWSLQKCQKQTFFIISTILRSKRDCSWVDCFEDCLRKDLSFSILGFRDLGFS